MRRLATPLARRIAAFAVCALVLYGVAPAIAEVLDAWPRVRRIRPEWFLAMVAAQAASLWCLWKLQAICMRAERLLPVATSSLVGGALGRVLPGGAATAAATQYAMLAHAGVSKAAIALGLAAGTLLQLVALCALPLLALPAMAFGVRVPASLIATSIAAGALFVGMVAITVLAFRSDRVLTAIARAAAWVLRRVRSRRGPPSDVVVAEIRDRRDDLAETLGRRWQLALLLAVGRWLFDFVTLEAALLAIDADPPIALTLVAYTGAQLLAQLPLTPGGLGVVEAGLAGALALAGLTGGQAAVATLAYRLVSYWLLLPAGAIAWVVHGRIAPRPTAHEVVESP